MAPHPTAGSKACFWRFGGSKKCGTCERNKKRCGSRNVCKRLSPLYEGHLDLIAYEDPKPGQLPEIKWIDFKFLFLLAVSLNPKFEIPKDRGRATFAAFPFRVKGDKKVEWLKMIRAVELEVELHDPRLDAWISTRDGEGDPFLDWIAEEMDDHLATFHYKLKECLEHRGA